jgi:NAD+ synthase
MRNTSILDSLTDQDYDTANKKLKSFLRQYLASSRSKGLVIGLSGGLDSSVTATACVRAIGRSKVFGLIMPTSTTPEADSKDAATLAEELGIESETVQLDAIISNFTKALPTSNDVKLVGNLTSRVRALVLYYYAGLRGFLVGGTSDKSELFIGYFTKFGDGSADIQPIASLYKTQVREFGKHLRVSEKILEKKSSPQLWPNHLAEREIGVTYETIDSVLYLLIDKKMTKAQICNKLHTSASTVEKIIKMVDSSAHKRLMPPAPRLL